MVNGTQSNQYLTSHILPYSTGNQAERLTTPSIGYVLLQYLCPHEKSRQFFKPANVHQHGTLPSVTVAQCNSNDILGVTLMTYSPPVLYQRNMVEGHQTIWLKR
jgi:hypothetical protein